MRLAAKLLICACFGAVVALPFGYMALDHNPQGEFADTMTGAYTADLYTLVGIMWGLAALPPMALLLVAAIVRRLIDRKPPAT